MCIVQIVIPGACSPNIICLYEHRHCLHIQEDAIRSWSCVFFLKRGNVFIPKRNHLPPVQRNGCTSARLWAPSCPWRKHECVNSPWYMFKMSWLCVYVCSSCRKPSRWREKGTGSILQAASKNQSLLDSSKPTPPAKACPQRPTEVRDTRAARSSRDPLRTRVQNQRTAPTSALRRMSRPRQTRLLLLRKVKRSVQTCRH